MSHLLDRAAVVLAGVVSITTAGLAAAEPAAAPEGGADEDEGAAARPRRGGWSVAFVGGALVPRGGMGNDVDPGLDVATRIAWRAANGLGLGLNVEYAPLRRFAENRSADARFDAHLFGASAGPRYTLGDETFRLWLGAGGGVLLERTRTDPTLLATPSPRGEVARAVALSGLGGLDVHFSDAAGLTVSATYTRDFEREYEFLSLTGGLVFAL